MQLLRVRRNHRLVIYIHTSIYVDATKISKSTSGGELAYRVNELILRRRSNK